MSCATRNDLRWLKTTSSKTLDSNGNLEIGVKFDRIEGSGFLFLISGCTTAGLRADGTRPERRQELMKLRTVGERREIPVQNDQRQPLKEEH